jgi:hypothetical protein
MPFISLLIASLICMVLALRLHLWPLGLLAVLLVSPPALVANVNYGGLLLLPCLFLAITIALRWSVGPVGWLSLILAAVGIWFVGVAGIFLLHWPQTFYWVLVLGIVTGPVALHWSHVPAWVTADRRGQSNP